MSALADDLSLKVSVEIARVCEARGAPWTDTPPGCALASVSGPPATSVDVSSILGSVPGDRQLRCRARHLLQLIAEECPS